MSDIGPSYDPRITEQRRGSVWERLLAYAWLGCSLVGVFLGLSKTGHPIVPGAAVMFLPAGALLSLHALLGLAGIGQIYNDPGRPRSRARLWQTAMLILGFGIAGPGLAVLTGDHVYRALAAPAITILGLTFLLQALRGRRTGWLARSGRANWAAYAGCWMFGLGWPVFVAWSLKLITLSSNQRQIETDPDKTSEVEVQFIPEAPDRTRVELEHRAIDRHGDGWGVVREGVDSEGGWPTYVRRFAEHRGRVSTV